jgi:hypothetical protein
MAELSPAERLSLHQKEMLRRRQLAKMVPSGGGGGRMGMVAPITQPRTGGAVPKQIVQMPEGGGGGTPTIDMGSGPILSGWSKPWYFHDATTLSAIVGTLVVADPSNTILATVGINGVPSGTVGIPAGQLTATHTQAFSFPAGSYWQMQVSSGSPTAQSLSWFGIL